MSKKLFSVLILICCATFAFAQLKVNSPYTRIGLGELVNPSFSHARGMGSMAAAYNDPFHTNIVNPASYAFLESTVFDVGINVKRNKLSDDATSQILYTGNLDYISLGFPTRNPINRAANPIKSPWYWGMNFSFTPYTNVGYRIESTEYINNDTLNVLYEGSGGTFKVMWGNAVRYNNFSVGLNFGYLFGKVSQEQIQSYGNIRSTYYNDFSDEFSLGSIIWDLGVQYRHKFKSLRDGKMEYDGRFLTVGAYGNSNNNVDFTTSQLYRRINPTYRDGNREVRDTLVNVENLEREGTLPGQIGIGAFYGKTNKGGLGIDFISTNWSKYINPIRPNESLNNSWRLAIGGNYTPDYRSIRSYWQRVNYQGGLFYGKDARSFDNSLTDYGISFGLGLPVINRNKQTSFINFAFEIGRLSADNAISETYGKVTVGFTLNNNEWFLKRKFY